MRKSFKYRLYPTPKQVLVLEEQLRSCGNVYNAALEERIYAYQARKKSISVYDQMAELPELKVAFPELKLVNSQVLQNVLKRLDRAYQAFFRRVKSGEAPGFPRFKNRDRYRSLEYSQTGYRLLEKKLKLANVGEVKVKLSRPIEGEVKTLTVSRNSCGHWYASFSCDLGSDPVPARPVVAEAGVDLGLEKFLTLSDGSMVPNPSFFRRSAETLKRRQQELATKPKQKPTKNRSRARLLVAKACEKVRNQRQDFHFKLANYLVRTYDRLVVEDLSVANMSRSARGTPESPGSHVAQKAGLNKSILDASWASFLEILSFKAENAGVRVTKVNPAHTSQVCSRCGTVVRKGLQERIHSCTCGLEIDRDWNAALNILRLGQSLG